MQKSTGEVILFKKNIYSKLHFSYYTFNSQELVLKKNSHFLDISNANQTINKTQIQTEM